MRWTHVRMLLVAGGMLGCASGAGGIDGVDASPRRDASAALDAPPSVDASEPPVDAPSTEADAYVAVDAASFDAAMIDAAPPLDASSVDASSDAGTDAARPIDPPIVDGTIDALEWSGATRITNGVATTWAGNELRALRALLRPEGLYLAIEGRVEGGAVRNAITVYLDRARGTTEGRALSTLTDATGAIDDALSPSAAAPYVVPATFVPDLAFATSAMSRTAAANDERIGWRDLVRAASGADLFWIPSTTAPASCGTEGCETFLPRSVLDAGMGAARPRTLALFARITNADGAQSPNQTLPEDAPATPRVVSALLELTE